MSGGAGFLPSTVFNKKTQSFLYISLEKGWVVTTYNLQPTTFPTKYCVTHTHTHRLIMHVGFDGDLIFSYFAASVVQFVHLKCAKSIG